MEPFPAVLLALALLACPGDASAARALQGPAHVVDGDTIVVGDWLPTRAAAYCTDVHIMRIIGCQNAVGGW